MSSDDIERKLREADSMGDALYGLLPDENGDPVKKVREIRSRYTGPGTDQ